MMVLQAWPLVLGIVSGGDGDRASLEAWRFRREAGLKAEDGWLTLAGLHWLGAGETLLGSDPRSDARLPAGAPAQLGGIIVEGGRVRIRLEPGVEATLGGQPFRGGELRTDAAGAAADVVSVGALRLMVIERSGRLALRVKDNDSPARRDFAGLRWYPFDPSWRVVGRFVPEPAPARLSMETIVGGEEVYESPGVVVFERDGAEHRLRAARTGEGLWFVFRDRTAGKTTAGGARQLSAEPPGPDGTVVLDFNRAANLPCAYTRFATCPLAPPENRLGLAVEAGEMIYLPNPEAGRD